MGRYVVKVPDIGEGMTEAEIVAWHVAPGQVIREEDPLVDVMTDKATVECRRRSPARSSRSTASPARGGRSARSWSCSMSLGEGNVGGATAAPDRSPEGRQPAGPAPHPDPLPACGERERKRS